MANKITIYTDGAARGNPGPAGWGVLIMFEHNDKSKVKSEKLKVVELGGRVGHGTNNQMELQSAIEALKYVKNNFVSVGEVEIYADSKYVILGITEWIHGWIKNSWRNAAKKPVLNRERWQELYDLSRNFKISWHYVEGHSGHEHNDRVDEIATNFADGEKIQLKNER